MRNGVKKSELEQLINDIHTHNINHHTREVYLHGSHDTMDGQEPGIEYRMADVFLKNVHLLNNKGGDNILVHMHTIGGAWPDGMAIFNAIRYSAASVTILAHSDPSSMSGVILQAADLRVLMPDVYFMIHHGSIGIEANSTAAKQAIDMSEKICKRMLQIFAKRATIGTYFRDRKYSVAKIASYLDRKIHDKSDWYLSADEAIYYGFADAILGQKGFEDIQKIRDCQKFKGDI